MKKHSRNVKKMIFITLFRKPEKKFMVRVGTFFGKETMIFDKKFFAYKKIISNKIMIDYANRIKRILNTGFPSFKVV